VHTTPTYTTIFTSISSHTTSATSTVEYGERDKIAGIHRSRNEDSDQFWFMVKAVWEAQGVMDENIKKETLVSAL